MPAPVSRGRTSTSITTDTTATQAQHPARANTHHSHSLDWPATLRARRNQPLAAQHLRWRGMQRPAPPAHIFLLDNSASMLRSGTLAYAKGLLLQWLLHACRQGTPVALPSFGSGHIRWQLPPQRAANCTAAFLASLVEPLGGGGGTPLASALHAAWHHSKAPCVLWVLSDFRSPDVLQLVHESPPPHIQHILLDCEATAPVRQIWQQKRAASAFHGGQRLARAWPATVRWIPAVNQ